MPETAPPVAHPDGEPIRVRYVPQPGLFGLTVGNFFLSLLTLTIYRFWAKTNVRRHIWSCVHINGEPLEYTGRGIELFKGALVVFFLFGLPAVVLFTAFTVAFGPDHPAIVVLQFALLLVVALLWGAALYRARRYQLSRTLWRGIRGTLAGSSMRYSLLYFGALLARGATLGWITPVMNRNLQRRMTGDMRFGDVPFYFAGPARPLYASYAVCWVLMLLTLAVGGAIVAYMLSGYFAAPTPEPPPALIFTIIAIYLLAIALYPIIWSMYTARELALFASYTAFDNARFRFDATAASLVRLAIGNLLIAVFTLGVGVPYVQQRLVRYLCDRIAVDGAVRVDRIRQSKAPLGRMGEGLADAFDVGGI